MVSPSIGFGDRQVNRVGLNGGSGLGVDCIPYDYIALTEAYARLGLVELCNQSEPGAQYACVQRNQPTLNAIQDLAGRCIQPSDLPQGYIPSPGSAGASNSGGSSLLQFDPSGKLVSPVTNNNLQIWNPALGVYQTPQDYAAWQAGQAYNPPTSTSGQQSTNGNQTNTSAPTTGTQNNPGNQTTQAAFSAGRLSFFNLTSGNNGAFRVGETYRIIIDKATPGAMVSASSWHDGTPLTSANMGSIGSDGTFQITAVMTPDTIGSWREQWAVGGSNPGGYDFSFTVQPIVSSSVGNTGGGGGVQPPNSYPPSNYPPATNQPSLPANVPPTSNGQYPPYLNNPSQGTVPNTNVQPPANWGTQSNMFSNIGVGFDSLFTPGNWGTVFSSGDTGEIIGLVAPLAIGAYMLMGIFGKRR